MYSTPQVNGIGCKWGVGTTGLTGYGHLVLQSVGQTLESDNELIKDQNGFTVTRVDYDHRESATLEAWVTGSTNSGSASIGSTTVPQPGDKLTITDSVWTLLSGSNWVCGNTSINGSNAGYVKVSIPLTRYAKIS
jgi:hypothetical protein